MTPLWPHQQRGLSMLRDSLEQHGRSLVVAPTGSGKSRLAGAVNAGAVRLGSTSLFVVHVIELVEQAVKEFRDHYGLHVGVIQADTPTDYKAPIQVATIQTLARREIRSYDLVTFDEVHLHVGNASTEKVIAANPNAWIVGLSATPWKLDGTPMGSMFRDIVTLASYSELISLGRLVPSRVFGPPLRPDMTRVHTRDGEFDKDETEDAVNRQELVADVAATYDRLAFAPRGHRPGIVFGHSIAHSIACRDALRLLGHRAEHLGYKTPKQARREMIEAFKGGEIDVLCNKNILTAGFDYPGLGYIADAAPTQSLAAYIQRIGRGMRADAGKRDLLVADHSGNVYRHGFAHADRKWTLEDAQKRSPRETIPSLRTCPACFAIFAPVPKCPECGHVFPVQAREIKQHEGQLREVRSAPTRDEKKAAFDKLCETAVQIRQGRGFVKTQYETKFGVQPRFEWPKTLPENLAKKRAGLERVAATRGYPSSWVDYQMQKGTMR